MPNRAGKNVVIWGAGRIGRGFAGDLFYAGGYHIIFVDAVPALIEQLRAAGRYTVAKVPGAGRRHDVVIDGYEALTTAQVEQVTAAVAAADYVVIAVFAGDFASVAQQLTPGLLRRRMEHPDVPLDILLCANLAHPGALFRPLLLGALPPEAQEYAAQRIGVVETVVIRMVADPPPDVRAAEPLLIWTNGTGEFPVDRRAFKGPLPEVPGLEPAENMRAEETRKLYSYNMCHAAVAYLGARHGYASAVDCLADPQVRADVEGALRESGGALSAEFGYPAELMAEWAAEVLRRVANPALNDQVARLGQDPRRKLRRSDRLVGPALLARKHGIQPVHLARAIAAGLLYRNPADPGAVWVQERVAALGVTGALREVCELTPADAELAAMIEAAYQEIKG
jgi:mannitol-1-phosphate 5-dehydrogenase